MGAALAALFVQNLFLLDSPVTTMQFALLAAFAVSMELRGAPCSAAALPRPSGRVLVRAVAMLVVVALTAATVYTVAYRPVRGGAHRRRLCSRHQRRATGILDRDFPRH